MPTPFERLRRELEAERQRLTNHLNSPVVAGVGEAIGYGVHQADHATEAFEQTKEMAIRQNTENLQRRVEAALARFNNGTYSLCTQCGKPIDPARLEAIPYAELCMECQGKLERKR
jgi:DnaK suppressor protein